MSEDNCQGFILEATCSFEWHVSLRDGCLADSIISTQEDSVLSGHQEAGRTLGRVPAVDWAHPWIQKVLFSGKSSLLKIKNKTHQCLQIMPRQLSKSFSFPQTLNAAKGVWKSANTWSYHRWQQNPGHLKSTNPSWGKTDCWDFPLELWHFQLGKYYRHTGVLKYKWCLSREEASLWSYSFCHTQRIRKLYSLSPESLDVKKRYKVCVFFTASQCQDLGHRLRVTERWELAYVSEKVRHGAEEAGGYSVVKWPLREYLWVLNTINEIVFLLGSKSFVIKLKMLKLEYLGFSIQPSLT